VTRELSRFYKDRYTEFSVDLIQTWGIHEQKILALDAALRTIYRRYLALACLTAILSQAGQRKDYIKGVSEVSYLGVVLTMKGLENPSCVLLRQSIELVLKHIYFAYHAVEYHWLATRPGYRAISFQFLLDYLKSTDEYSIFPASSLLLNEIERQFGVLSRFVHMHSRSFIPYTKTTLASANSTVVTSLEQRTKELWPLLMCLLIAHFPAKFLSANKNERSLIVGGLGTSWHNRVKDYLRSLAP
jgi:hypothetical protein